MNWSNDEFAKYLREHGVTDTGGWACPGSQKQKAHHARAIDNRTQNTKMDDKLREQFCVTIEIQVSDLRVRDLDGSVSTIFDCLVAARRQLENHSELLRVCEDGAKGGRGGDNNS
tara:strand:+ start:1126 stop:1470 length:345 start_codon:yes stop_codon:yes gene_type:complete